MRGIRALAVLAAVAVLSGCGVLPTLTGPEPTPTPLTIEPVLNDDRDADAVAQAMASLDPCALLDPALVAGREREPELHHCRIPGVLKVDTWASAPASQRFWEERADLAGAAAYRNTALWDWCEIRLPVDFAHAIVFAQDPSQGAYDCAEPIAFAEAAVKALAADPASLRHADPRDGLVACDVFEQVVGPAADGDVLAPRSGLDEGLGDCGIWKDSGGVGFTSVTPESGLNLRRSPALADLRANYGWAEYPTETLAGREVLIWFAEGDEDCRIMWDAWASPAAAGTRQPVVGATASARTCDEARELVAELAPALDRAKPADADLDGLLYAADEPDTAATGVCVDVEPGSPCAEAVEATVPDSAAEVVAWGERDPNVLCTAAWDAVREALGEELRPAVVAERDGTDDPAPICMFVRPRHDLVVRIQATDEELTYVFGDGDETTIAGRAATVKSEAEFSRAVIAVGEAEEPGVLRITVTALPDRADGRWDTAPVDTAPLDDFEDDAAAIAEAVLGPAGR